MREALKYINRVHVGCIEPLVGVEVGVREGKNALSMLQSMPILKLYLVDHYKEHVEHSNMVVTQKQQDIFYANMLNNLKKHMDKIEILKMNSLEASKLIADSSLDFVYIDGDHRYEAVMADLKAWLPKIKSKRYLCGHDFNNKQTPEVAKAVRDFCRENDLPLYQLDDIDWITIK